jgi:hypothetical protein
VMQALARSSVGKYNTLLLSFSTVHCTTVVQHAKFFATCHLEPDDLFARDSGNQYIRFPL